MDNQLSLLPLREAFKRCMLVGFVARIFRGTLTLLSNLVVFVTPSLNSFTGTFFWFVG
jgi:hypothetical protein